MTTLNLFPARIAFVNPDGTLTNEAYRALTVLFARVGGPLGDNGTDTFNNQVVMGQAADNPAITDTLEQPASPERLMVDLLQQTNNTDLLLPDLMQIGGVMRPTASGGAVASTAATNVAPYGYTTAAQADAIVTLLNNIRTCLIANGLMT
ncbi:MAG: hypothetical protein RL032_1706 [Pseudomonadota bacterium]|jgi:hypothetical protein